MLDETRKNLWKVRIEGAGINSLCGTSDDLGTAAFGVAGRAVQMGNAAVIQNAAAVQEIVDQRINDQHGLTGLEPTGPVVACAYHKPGQRIGQDLVGHAENFS